MVIFHNVDYNSMCLPWLLLFLERKKIFHDLMIILLASGECRVQEQYQEGEEISQKQKKKKQDWATVTCCKMLWS
jgi:hypothetical protein